VSSAIPQFPVISGINVVIVYILYNSMSVDWSSILNIVILVLQISLYVPQYIIYANQLAHNSNLDNLEATISKSTRPIFTPLVPFSQNEAANKV